jgi:uncharacterized protein with PIN domain
MKIHSIPPQGPIDKIEKYAAARVKTAAEAEVEKKGRVDRVVLNSDAKIFSTSLKAIKESIKAEDTDKEKRIAEVSRQIQARTYSVSGEDVARKILGKDLK